HLRRDLGQRQVVRRPARSPGVPLPRFVQRRRGDDDPPVAAGLPLGGPGGLLWLPRQARGGGGQVVAGRVAAVGGGFVGRGRTAPAARRGGRGPRGNRRR